MIRTYRQALALVVPLTLAALALGQQAAPGFTPLFNGSNLTGWRYGKAQPFDGVTETPEKRFFVSGGAIVMAQRDKDGKTGIRELLTNRNFEKDFILKLEFKAANEATGAVTIRNAVIPVGDYVRRNDQKHLKRFRNDDWNELEVVVKMAAHAEGRRMSDSDNLEITVVNGKAQVKVNGRVVDPNATLIRIEGHPRVNGEGLVNYTIAVPTRGDIGLRTSSGKIEFRNIQFKELP